MGFELFIYKDKIKSKGAILVCDHCEEEILELKDGSLLWREELEDKDNFDTYVPEVLHASCASCAAEVYGMVNKTMSILNYMIKFNARYPDKYTEN